MGGKKKAPPAPDYAALAQQQQAANTANYNQQLKDSRVNQTTEQGSLNWSQDPTTGQWTQTQTYSPETQALYDKAMANQNQALGVQSSANSQLQDLMAKGAWQAPGLSAAYDQDYANKYADQMQQTLTARMAPQYQHDQDAMQTKLSLQGLQPGTEAYNRAYQNLLTSQGDVMSQANLQAQLAGQSEARNQYNTELTGQEAANTLSLQQYMTPWNTASQAAGLAGSVQTPSFSSPTAGTPGLTTPDIMGAAQQTYAQQMQNVNDSNSSKSGKGQAIGTVVGGVAGSMVAPGIGTAIGASAGGALGSSMSDLRLKDNVQAMSDEEAFNALLDIVPITWNWKGFNTADAGVAAQQIAERMPELSGMAAGKYLTVNYTKLVALQQGAFRHLAKQLSGERHGL